MGLQGASRSLTTESGVHLDGVMSPVPPRWGRSQAHPPEEEEGGTKQNSHGRGGEAGPESGGGRSQRDALSLPDAWPQPQPPLCGSPCCCRCRQPSPLLSPSLNISLWFSCEASHRPPKAFRITALCCEQPYSFTV